jgi:hypothetical protein
MEGDDVVEPGDHSVAFGHLLLVPDPVLFEHGHHAGIIAFMPARSVPRNCS